MQMDFVGYCSNRNKVFASYADDAHDYGRAFDAGWRKTSSPSAPIVFHMVHEYERLPEKIAKRCDQVFVLNIHAQIILILGVS